VQSISRAPVTNIGVASAPVSPGWGSFLVMGTASC